MNKSCIIILCCCTSLLFADTHLARPNGLGWDSGLSYRRYVSDTWWMSATVSGSATTSKTRDTTVTQSSSLDSTATNTVVRYDSTISYSGTLKLELGKEAFRYKFFALNAFASGSYTYADYKMEVSGSPESGRAEPRNTLTAAIGLEPTFWITNVFSVGTDFGIQYSYTFGKDYSSSDNSTTRGVYTSQSFRVFGNVSLTAGLNAFFYF
jgi:hypothetical protein